MFIKYQEKSRLKCFYVECGNFNRTYAFSIRILVKGIANGLPFPGIFGAFLEMSRDRNKFDLRSRVQNIAE